MFIRLAALIVAVECAVAAPAFALDPRTDIRQYVRADWQDTLPQSTVLSILQSRDGYIWIATYSGLARFDGARFQVFDPSNSDLAIGAMTGLVEDRSGVIWAGSVGGGLYRFERGTFTRVSPAGLGEIIYSIAADDAGRVWVGTNRGFGYIAQGKYRQFTAADGAGSHRIRAIVADRDGVVWLGTEGGGLLRYENDRFTRFTQQDGLASDMVYALAKDNAGRLWIGTYKGGVDVLHNGRFGETRLRGQSVIALRADGDAVWVGGEAAGLCRLAGERVDCDPLGEADTVDLIRSLLIDREGSLWVGGTNSGLHRFADAKVKTTLAAESNNHVRTVFEDARGDIWAGMDGDGLHQLRDRTLVPFAGPGRLPNAFIRSVIGDRAGNLWVGTLGGLARISNGGVTSYSVRDGLSGDFVYVAFEDRSGGLWIGTTSGLNRRVGERFETVIPSVDVRSMLEDSRGRLWIGLRDGLICRDGTAVSDCGLGTAFRGTAVFGFHQDTKGEMWIASAAGIARLQGRSLVRYRARDGLPDDSAFAILEDASANLWISSNKGIYRITRGALDDFDQRRTRAIALTMFGKADGMAAAQCNGTTQPSAWKSRDGRLWFSTVKGVVTVDPENIRTNSMPPPVAVSQLSVDGALVPLDALDSVGPGAQRLEIDYAALSYVAPERVRFRYRLDGFDTQWVEAGTRRTAYYTNLPPGDYSFHVIAANEDGQWNTTGVTVPFRIAPHWYETWWYRSLLVLIVGVALISAYRIRVWQLRVRERALVALVDQRTNELRAANLELERLAVVDALTGVPNRRAFDQALATFWSEHRRRDAELSLLICDVDYFKRYNDRYGHQAGDAALTQVAGALRRAATRSIDVVARYGGEEFALLLPNTSAEGAAIVSAAVIDAVAALQLPHDDSDVAPVITLSVGAATMAVSSEQAHTDLIEAADRALYRAKAAGRNRVVTSTPPRPMRATG